MTEPRGAGRPIKLVTGQETAGSKAMAIAWTAAMATGNQWLDREHRRLVAGFDGLLTAIEGRHDASVVEASLRRVGDAALRSFSVEEDCLLRESCPAAVASGPAHAELIGILAAFREDYERHGQGDAVAARLEEALTGWVTRHVPGPGASALPCVRSAS